ncbi:jg25381 [Pararge aegeria aegeria]|uniref:Jg25381 protein n=1 Tax=Pararge aegeria aegeria TaxID=348720 RepID=A0A8S4S0R3_9NEOP|nr:jg25381 [Pararge aegeria aegeria]
MYLTPKHADNIVLVMRQAARKMSAELARSGARPIMPARVPERAASKAEFLARLRASNYYPTDEVGLKPQTTQQSESADAVTEETEIPADSALGFKIAPAL